MQVIVMSEEQCFKSINQIDTPTAMISIFHPGSKVVFVKENPFVQYQFVLKFHDVDIGESYHIGLKPATAKTFCGLKDFIDKAKQSVATFIVHCPGGVSRSAGVAAAVSEYLMNDKSIWQNKIYHPNLLAYKLVCAELGISKTLEDMDVVYQLRLQNSMFHDKNLDIYYERYRRRNLLNINGFRDRYCKLCGTQRCEGPESEWFDGCEHRDMLRKATTSTLCKV